MVDSYISHFSKEIPASYAARAMRTLKKLQAKHQSEGQVFSREERNQREKCEKEHAIASISG